MEPQSNQRQVPSEPTLSQTVPTSLPSSQMKKRYALMGVASILIVGGFLGYVYFSNTKENSQQEALQAINQQNMEKYQDISARIIKGDTQTLTRDEYAFYLNYSIDRSDQIPQEYIGNARAGTFTIAFEKKWSSGNLVVFGPEILFGDGYIVLDEVEGENGKEDISKAGFESKEKNTFIKISEYEKRAENESYSGKRKLHIKTPAEELIKISGRLVLPFFENTETVKVTNTDSEKTLHSGKLENITFTGNTFTMEYVGTNGLYGIKAYNQNKEELSFVSVTSLDGSVKSSLFGEYEEVPHSVELFFGNPADIEIPFVFEFPEKEIKQSDTQEENIQNTTVSYSEKTTVSPEVTQAEKVAIVESFEDIKKIVSSKNIEAFINYLRVTTPDNKKADFEKTFLATDPKQLEEEAVGAMELVEMVLVASSDDLLSTYTKWKKQNADLVTVEFNDGKTQMRATFLKINEKWYFRLS